MRRNHHAIRFTFFRSLGYLVATSVLATSCSGSEPAEVTISTVETATSTVETATSTVDVSPSSTDATEAEATQSRFTETSDIAYMTINESDLFLDVYIPAGEGPWPVVVAFHELDSDGKDARDMIPVLEAAAAQGMVVFAPSWIIWDPPPFPFTAEGYEEWKRAANCAVAFAQENAADYSGDPTRTVVYGFSAGAGAGLLAALQPSADPIPGCQTDAAPTPVIGAVLGDGEYFLHSQNFDEAFQAGPGVMAEEVAASTDSTYWPPDMKTKFFLWVADSGTSPRSIDDARVPGWLGQRDADGSIRADLDRLGQLEDGTVNFIDAGELIELRLSEAGIEVTLDSYPGGHTTANKIPELLGYLKAATGE